MKTEEFMSALPLEERVTILEAEVQQLKHRLGDDSVPATPWWEKISGTFANNQAFDEAMELGHQYRESLRPRSDINRQS